MRRVRTSLSSGAVVIAALSVLTANAVAAVAPGTYKGSLYQATGVKIANAPATISVIGTKVTINAPRLPIMFCQPTAPTPCPRLLSATSSRGHSRGTR